MKIVFTGDLHCPVKNPERETSSNHCFHNDNILWVSTTKTGIRAFSVLNTRTSIEQKAYAGENSGNKRKTHNNPTFMISLGPYTAFFIPVFVTVANPGRCKYLVIYEKP